MRPQIVTILTFVLCVFTGTNMLAQQTNAGSGPPEPTNQRGPLFPIDDSILILLAIGLIFGCYIVVKNIRAKKTPA